VTIREGKRRGWEGRLKKKKGRIKPHPKRKISNQPVAYWTPLKIFSRPAGGGILN